MAQGFTGSPAASPLTTKGDLFGYSTTNDRLPTGTNGQGLRANSSATTGLQWYTDYNTKPVWVLSGSVSGATTSAGKPLPMPQDGVWAFFSAVLRTPCSLASLMLDINKNGTSIFTNQATRPIIPINGTYVSTASIGTLPFVGGDIFTIDIDFGGGLGQDLTILGGGKPV